MAPRRILLTGAGGFVAGHLRPLLRAAFPDAAIIEMGGQGAKVDLADGPVLAKFVAEAPPDACVHLAAVTAVPAANADPDTAWRINLMGTLSLARALQAANPASVLLFASSAEIYGRSFAAGVALDEGGLPAPMNTYAATKAAADLALGAMAATGLRVIRMRPGPASRPPSWCRPSRGRWRGSPPGCRRRFCRWGRSIPIATSSMCATCARPMWRRCRRRTSWRRGRCSMLPPARRGGSGISWPR